MTEGGLWEYVDKELEKAKISNELTDAEFSKLNDMVEKGVKKDLADGIPYDSKEMEENIIQMIEYYIDEIRNPS